MSDTARRPIPLSIIRSEAERQARDYYRSRREAADDRIEFAGQVFDKIVENARRERDEEILTARAKRQECDRMQAAARTVIRLADPELLLDELIGFAELNGCGDRVRELVEGREIYNDELLAPPPSPAAPDPDTDPTT